MLGNLRYLISVYQKERTNKLLNGKVLINLGENSSLSRKLLHDRDDYDKH